MSQFPEVLELKAMILLIAIEFEGMAIEDMSKAEVNIVKRIMKQFPAVTIDLFNTVRIVKPN